MLFRIAQGYNAYQFAALVGVHPNWWRETERGQRKPSATIASKAGEILGRTLDELFVDAPECVPPAAKKKNTLSGQHIGDGDD